MRVIIFLRAFRSSRNLLSSKRKNHPARWFLEGSLTDKFLNYDDCFSQSTEAELALTV